MDSKGESKMIEDSWQKMLQLIHAHNELVYPRMTGITGKIARKSDKFQVTPLNFPNHFRRPRCNKCGNLVARKFSSLKLWRQRDFLCQKCFKPTSLDYDILTRLKAYLNLEGRRYFTADDLYRLGLVQLLPEPHNRTVGGWFSRMQHAGVIGDMGDLVPSLRVTNNSRRIKRFDAFPERGGAFSGLSSADKQGPLQFSLKTTYH